MSALRIMGRAFPVACDAGDNEDSARTAVRVSCNARTARRLTASRRAPALVALVRDMREAGELAPAGCDCSHCANDWDCCGRFSVWRTYARRVRGGVLILQDWTRNI